MTGELCVMNHTGDLKLVWNSQNTGEVEEARKMFNDMKAKGYLAYKVQGGGDKGEVITAFEPDAGKIIMAPPLAGG